MMEENDLPFAARRLQLILEPLELRSIHVVAIECEKANAQLRPEAVVLLSAHVEVLVRRLTGRIVVVPKRGIKFYSGRQRCLKGLLEFVREISRIFATVQVVTEHQYELKGDLRPTRIKPCCNLIFRS